MISMGSRCQQQNLYPPHPTVQHKTFPAYKYHWKRTCRRCIGSRLGRSRRDSWTWAWTRSPFGWRPLRLASALRIPVVAKRRGENHPEIDVLSSLSKNRGARTVIAKVEVDPQSSAISLWYSSRLCFRCETAIYVETNQPTWKVLKK